MKREVLARYIDHTLLKPDATPEQVAHVCHEALAHHFAAVCINPIYVPQAAALLSGSDVAVCTVVGFPLGATATASKVYETEVALAQGAREIDMVIAIGLLKAGELERVRADIAAVAAACQSAPAPGGALLKVIIETALLTDAEKVTACELAQQAGAQFVKTSTGFAASGATAADIALMRRTVGPAMGVKASGGVRTYADALAMIQAGATRIGASASVTILAGADAE